MKIPSMVACVLGCLLAVGCRVNPKITMLEQECRMHEDRIYALQDQLSMTQNALCDAKQENSALREQARSESGNSTRSFSPSSSLRSSKSADPDVNAPSSVDVTLPDEGTKEVSSDALENLMGPPSRPEVKDPNALPSLETPSAPPVKQNWTSPGEGTDSPERVPSGKPVESQIRIEDGKVLYPQEGPRLQGDSETVKEITISKVMTGGVNADGQEGDEGVFVVVEPRDADGRLVSAVAPISIIAIDPALPEEKARLAQWNFSEKEVASQFRRSGSAEGFHLEVRWPDRGPHHEQLKLFVRYTTADERRLYAEVPVQIALAPKESSLVTRPVPRRLETADSQGWATKPNSQIPVEEVFEAEDAVSPRVASAPARPIRQSIPPQSEKPSYTRPSVSRPRPVWSPER